MTSITKRDLKLFGVLRCWPAGACGCRCPACLPYAHWLWLCRPCDINIQYFSGMTCADRPGVFRAAGVSARQRLPVADGGLRSLSRGVPSARPLGRGRRLCQPLRRAWPAQCAAAHLRRGLCAHQHHPQVCSLHALCSVSRIWFIRSP